MKLSAHCVDFTLHAPPPFSHPRMLHAAIITTGLAKSADSFLHNALLYFHAACGIALQARKVFEEIPSSNRDTVDWTVMMGCLARQGMHRDALRLFVEMRRENVSVDDLIVACLLGACARLEEVEVGVQGHGLMVKAGLGLSVKVCNAAMDMYVKCGELSLARRVFEEMEERSVVSWTVVLDGVVRWEGVESGRAVFDAMPERNEVAWTVMIVGYVSVGLVREGFGLLKEMVFRCGLGLNYATVCSFLSACSQSGDVVMGRWVHAYACKTTGSEMDVMVGTALVDMYAKCGRVDTALRVFENMKYRNVVAWNALLSGLAMHGRGSVVMKIFPRMLKEAKPDDLTFISLLSACSHSGLVEAGRHYFQNLEPLYGVTRKMEHYACMVDLLGRALLTM